MNSTRYVSLLGLGFGDCGKGRYTDHFAREWGAHTVVRFNGGAQAGHNVLLADGRHHTFAQFGAGSFNSGTGTLLASPVVVHPTALLVEHEVLRRAGVADGMARLLIDARCRVTTPFHQAMGRLREWARGADAHGTCGVGVGETVRQALAMPDEALVYGDLARPALALGKLAALRTRLRSELDALPLPSDTDAAQERAMLDDADLARRWLAAARPCVQQAPPASRDAIGARLGRPGVVLFEGAQGVLLDEWQGFHPHTSWSTVSTAAVDAVLSDAGIEGARVQHLGVLRSYLTRHGAGPLPTQDAALDRLAEPHNADQGWQGRFRRGQPDAVLWRHALAAVGRLDGLAATHLDAIGGGLRWCEAYALPGEARPMSTLPRSAGQDLAHQAMLTRLLHAARPRYDPHPVATSAEWVARIEALSGCPVRYGGFGPAASQVQAFSPLPD